MDPAVTTGIFSVAGTAGGTLLGYGLNTLNRRASDRAADRQKAQDLYAQIIKAIGAMEVEKAAFRERRDGWRPNALALGSVLLELIAARAAGNWVSGTASGTSRIIAWDSAEGARFVDRYQAVTAEITPALVQLSLMSPGLQDAAATASDALGAATTARKAADRQAAARQLNDSIAKLRAEVHAYTTRRWWKRTPRPAQTPPALSRTAYKPQIKPGK